SAIFGDKDLADYLVEVEPGRNLAGGVLRFTSRSAEIAGVVTNAASQPVVTAAVLVFPEDRRLWVPQSRRIHVAPIASDGRYSVKGLPPGDYRIIVADPEPQQQFDVQYLSDLFTLATLVSLAEGEKKTQDLRSGS
ncbi:MAG TPA: carboxypeptidase-like regulatory domain-containing protein, partial [Vicinamibacterales bacterium]